MKAKIFFFSVLCSTLMFSQQTKLDSLQAELKVAKQDTIKLQLLKEIAKETYFMDVGMYKKASTDLLEFALKTENPLYIGDGYNSVGRYHKLKGEDEKAKTFYLKALQQYRKADDKSGEAIIYGNIAAIYIGQNQIDSTRKYLNLSIEINKKHSLYENLFYNYYNLGISESNHSESQKSINSFRRALFYAEKIQNHRFISLCHSMIGVLYMEQEMYNSAEKYLLRAQEEFATLDDAAGLAQTHVNLGKLYNERDDDFIRAISFHKKGIAFYEKIGDSINAAVAIGNVGRNFIQLNVLDSAAYYLNKSLLISEELQQPNEVVRSLTNLAEVAFKQGKSNQAKELLGRAILEAQVNNFMESHGDALLLLSDINAEEGDYKSAFLNLTAHKSIFDSIKSAETKEMILEISTKYQSERKENENLALKQQNAEQALLMEREKNQKLAIGSGLVVALAGLGIFFIAYRKNQKQKQEIEKQKDLVEDLQRELHHRLKNNLSFIDFFITLAKGKFPDPAYREKLDELQNRINSMFEVHKQLFKKEDVTSVNARTYISALVENVKKAYAVPNITFEEYIDDTNLRADTSFPIGLIV
ncbi:MAG TPA: histidine kinase dimerization/phosphoacceptor domain -containing protein, partial [Aequorivita sp.]|nr:histidine kinase dimerization/phosphoacceptor domain -containing protein [Aequorivita sp.]